MEGDGVWMESGRSQRTGADGMLCKQCWESVTWGCGCSGGRGGVVMGGAAEQMGWGHVDFALNADLF